MKISDLVSVQSFIDGVLQRRVVEISGDTVYICTEKEWQEASTDRREPDCVGFNTPLRHIREISRSDCCKRLQRVSRRQENSDKSSPNVLTYAIRLWYATGLLFELLAGW
jgi:hypothetical protein